MAVSVVNEFESIEVKIGHRQALPAPLCLRHGLMQPVGQQHAVGHRGQRVIVCDMFELLFMLLQRRDVGEQRHILLGLAVCVAHGTDGLHHRIHLAVLAPVPDFAGPVAGIDQILPHGGEVLFFLATGVEDARGLAEHFVAAVTGESCKGLIDVDDGAVGCGDHDAFAGMRKHAGRKLEIFLRV